MTNIVLLIICLLFIAYTIYSSRPTWWFQQASSDALNSLEQGDYEKSIEHYREILRVALKSGKAKRDAIEFCARQGMGTCLHSLSRFDEAENELCRAAELLDAGVKQQPIVELAVYYEYASCLSIRGQTEASDEQLQKMEHMCDGMSPDELTTSLANLRQRAREADIGYQFRLASRIRELVISRAKQADPPNRDLIVNSALDRASALNMQGKYAEAKNVVEQALSGYDDLDEATLLNAWRLLGMTATLLGDQKNAVEYYERALEQTKKRGQELEVLAAELTLAVGQHLYGDDRAAIARAKPAFERICESQHPDSLLVQSTSMQVMPLMLVAGEFDTANEFLVRMESQSKEHLRYDASSMSIALVYRSSFFLRVGCPQEALEAAEDSITQFRMTNPERDPMSWDGAILLPVSLIRLGRLDEADQVLKEMHLAATADPQRKVTALRSVDLHLTQAELECCAGNFAESLVQAEKAAGLLETNLLPTHSELPEAWLLVGQALVGMGRAEEAIRWYEKAESLRSQFQPSHHLAFATLYEAWSDAYQLIGEAAKAEELRIDARKIRSKWADVIEQSVQQWRLRAK